MPRLLTGGFFHESSISTAPRGARAVHPTGGQRMPPEPRRANCRGTRGYQIAVERCIRYWGLSQQPGLLPRPAPGRGCAMGAGVPCPSPHPPGPLPRFVAPPLPEPHHGPAAAVPPLPPSGRSAICTAPELSPLRGRAEPGSYGHPLPTTASAGGWGKSSGKAN